MRRRLVLVVGVLLLAGCASARDGGAPPAVGPESDPVELVDLWRVAADGEGPDTWLRLDARSYQVWRDCGRTEGGWTATGRGFLASAPNVWSGSCGDSQGAPQVAWLSSAATYEPTPDGWRLVDSDGTELATLTIAGAPPPDPNTLAPREPPEVNDEVRSWLADPPQLPVGLAPVTRERLIGRWVPLGSFPTEPYVEFADDGTWVGSDGCNGGAGAWRVEGGGRLLTTAGPSSLVWCEGASVPYWLAAAARAGLDGEVLVLLDHDGAELGRLSPA